MLCFSLGDDAHLREVVLLQLQRRGALGSAGRAGHPALPQLQGALLGAVLWPSLVQEQVLQVGRPNAVTVTRQSEEASGCHLMSVPILFEAIFEVVAPSDVEDPRTRCTAGALCPLDHFI